MTHLSPSTSTRRTGLLAVLGLLATASAAWGQTPASFAPVSNYPTDGGTPTSMVVADVNSDGRLDVVTLSANSLLVSVLLGQAAGGFAPASSYTSSAYPVGVAVGDVNGDGQPDIVTANIYTDTAGVLLGQASGGFVAGSSYPTGAGSYPNSVVVTDVNGDGRQDIVTANLNGNTVGVLLGQASGGFAAASTYPVGAGSAPWRAVVADVNSDGQPDLLSVNPGNGSVGVLPGQVGGGFAAINNYNIGANSRPWNVAVGDVNSDGRPDLVTASQANGSVGVLLGQASGSFAAVSSYPAGNNAALDVSLADVNGDGRLDIVTANTLNSTAGILLGRASGGFAAVSTFSTGIGSEPNALATADVNSDGRPDIITANFGTRTVGVLLNTGTFTPLAATTATAAAAAEVALFPNPTHGSFTVQLPAAWTTAPVRAELLNTLGQVVSTQAVALPADEPTLHVATTGLAAGVYLLRLQAGPHTLARRVAVK